MVTENVYASDTHEVWLDLQDRFDKIIDTGATDYMASNSDMLKTMIGLPDLRKGNVNLPNGKTVHAFGKGSYNLTYSDDLYTGRVKGIGKEEGGLYLLLPKGFNKSKFGKNVKMFRTDNGAESFNHEYRDYLTDNGILHQSSYPHTPQQNRMVERRHKHVLEVARTLRYQGSISLQLWGDCVMVEVYLISRLPSSVLAGRSPYEELIHEENNLIAADPNHNVEVPVAEVVEDIPDEQPRRSTKGSRPHIWIKDYETEPTSYVEAMKDPRWIESMKAEVGALVMNNTWEVADVLKDKVPIGCSDNTMIQEAHVTLHKVFKIKDLGNLKYFLGIKRKYTLELIEELGLAGAMHVITPIEQNKMLTTAEYDEHYNLDDDPTLTDVRGYQRLVGKLLYLTFTRPDITYSMHTLSQFMQSPKRSHLEAAYRVVRYVKNEPGLRILMSSAGNMTHNAYFDADWASCPNSRKSVPGYLVKFGESLIS
ncbi:uncharacterized protein [Nicotiana tomentosiformis]|uniref:uncharacterized protein n=1 Tax=Nicotiana tomentosiformis TaxID=4098 RepID=UPI00388C6C6A